MERELAAQQEAEPLTRHSSAADQPPVFDRPSPKNLGGNLAAQHDAKVADASTPAAAGSGTPPADKLSEAACVTENLDEENRLSYTTPGRIAARTSPSPPAISLFNYANDQAIPKSSHVKYLSSLHPALAKSGVGVKIVGRASCPGKAAHNVELSENRAAIVADLLKPDVRVVDVEGAGESQPVADNSTAEGRSRNRAVDIIPLPPPPPPPSLCKIFPALCRVPPPPPGRFCEKHPEICQVPDFCQLFPALCQDCTGDDCNDDHDHQTFCEKHPVVCLLVPACILAPEVCLACIEDPALCVGVLECILNPSSCTSPPRPPKPPKATTPVIVTFTPVRAANTPDRAQNRIPDKGATAVGVVVTGWKPSMPPIRIHADGRGGINGNVAINGADELFITGSTIIQVEGLEQTSPSASFLPLSLQATMGPAPVGHGSPFAVADFMENIDIDLEAVIITNSSLLDGLQSVLTGIRLIQDDSKVGMKETMNWDSDGAQGLASLDQVRFFGLFHVRSSSGSWNPLQGSARGGLGDTPLPFFFTEDVPLRGKGRRQTDLLWVLEDWRSHSRAVITNSGYEIDEEVEADPLRSGCLRLVVTHKGSAVSVQGVRSSAGSGTAAATIPLECDLVCGSPQLPDTDAHWTGGDRGENMTANPLTRCGEHGSTHRNSVMTLPGWKCIDDAGQNDFWVHAHLLHGKTGSPDLHGPGNKAENLIITDKSINKLMSDRVELDAIDRTLKHQTLSYEVTALHMADAGDKRFFADGMQISLNRIDPVTRHITEIIFNNTIRSDTRRQPPLNCT